MHTRHLRHYLRTYRKRAGLTQAEVAFLLGYSNGARISRIERMRRRPTVEDLLAYEALFRQPVRRLLAGRADEVERRTIQRIGRLARRLQARKPDKLTEYKLDALAESIRAFNAAHAEDDE